MSPRRAVTHVFLALLSAAIPLTAQHVEARSGNVVLIGLDGSVRLLTTTGLDSDPDFSEKPALVVYVHRKAPPPPMGEGEIEPVDNTELWTVNTMGPPAPKPVFTGLVSIRAEEYGLFLSPRWSPGGRRVYFLSGFFVTSNALNRLNMSSGKVEFLTAALDFAPVQEGRWRGCLVAAIRTYYRAEDGLSYPHYPYFLLTPNGGKVRRVGRENERLEAVVARVAGTRLDVAGTNPP